MHHLSVAGLALLLATGACEPAPTTADSASSVADHPASGTACPIGVVGVHVEAQDVEGGVALVLTAGADRVACAM